LFGQRTERRVAVGFYDGPAAVVLTSLISVALVAQDTKPPAPHPRPGPLCFVNLLPIVRPGLVYRSFDRPVTSQMRHPVFFAHALGRTEMRRGYDPCSSP
jgi:hypothetical protein